MVSSPSSSTPPSFLPHIGIFPFMSKGHTIPLLHLASLLHRRRLANLTFFTTPLNAPFLRHSLADVDVSIVELPFPHNLPDLPPGVESTDRLPSISLFLPFINAVKLLRPHFERAIDQSPTPFDLLISDGFLGWTNDSAGKFSIPRLVFYGMGCFAMTICAIVSKHKPHADVSSLYESFEVPGFPELRLNRADLGPLFGDPDPKGPAFEFVLEQTIHDLASKGMVVNSFYELEAAYLDRWNTEFGPTASCIGPLCLARESIGPIEPPSLKQWLDSRLAMNRPVLYVSFGSQADLSEAQIVEIAVGLDRSRLDFLWLVRTKDNYLPDRFEEQVQERGLVVKEWVDQMAILQHEAVKGFLSHCGWNSVMESMSTGVPILALPMMAEQDLNAKFLVEELRIGLRIRAREGDHYGLKAEDVEKQVKELLLGKLGKVAMENVMKLAEAAAKAMDEHGGSSCLALENIVHGLSRRRVAEEENDNW